MSTPETIVIANRRKVYEVPEIRDCEGCIYDVSPSRCGASMNMRKRCGNNETIFIDATPLALAEYALNKE
jgi:hypothetical protein